MDLSGPQNLADDDVLMVLDDAHRISVIDGPTVVLPRQGISQQLEDVWYKRLTVGRRRASPIVRLRIPFAVDQRLGNAPVHLHADIGEARRRYRRSLELR